MSDNKDHLGIDTEEPYDPNAPEVARAEGDGIAPTTTHAAPGQGRPRLIFKVGGEAEAGELPREFDLLPTSTRIGSSAEMDLQLDGIEPFHAEIRHDDSDEYIYNRAVIVGEQNIGVLEAEDEPGDDLRNNAPDGLEPGLILRTGAELTLGPWTMSYYREEFADHGRPFGGREGGEGTHQPQQPVDH